MNRFTTFFQIGHYQIKPFPTYNVTLNSPPDSTIEIFATGTTSLDYHVPAVSQTHGNLSRPQFSLARVWLGREWTGPVTCDGGRQHSFQVELEGEQAREEFRRLPALNFALSLREMSSCLGTNCVKWRVTNCTTRIRFSRGALEFASLPPRQHQFCDVIGYKGLFRAGKCLFRCFLSEEIWVGERWNNSRLEKNA
jgi:hypothetical protein